MGIEWKLAHSDLRLGKQRPVIPRLARVLDLSITSDLNDPTLVIG